MSCLSGRNNPNCKYKTLNDSFFEEVETEEKAYILGWIASDGSLRQRGFCLEINYKDREILEQIKNIICSELPLKVRDKKGSKMISLEVNSQKMAKDISGWLGVGFGKKADKTKIPNFSSKTLIWAFLRGYFDGDGSAVPVSNCPCCSITSISTNVKKAIADFTQIPCYINQYRIVFYGNNALDFLSKIYDNAKIYLSRKRDLYLDYCLWIPAINGAKRRGKEISFKWVKTDKNAVPPFKARASDSGYDLTLIKKIKSNGVVDFYGTGIRVCPDFGWYFDLVPRSSITKFGYILANSIGVLDRSYVGEVIVPLIKIDANMPDLELPAKIVQIIPRPIVHLQSKEVDKIEETQRGSGGFGSTNEK